MSKIGIIIPIFNGIDLTKKCLENLDKQINSAKQTNIKHEIVIIDDGSTDGSADWISSNYPNIEVLKGNGNLWWSGGVNKGAKYAIETLRVDYILLWNNDIFTDTNYFTELHDIIAKEKADTIIGSKIYYDPQFQKIWSMGAIFDTKSGKKYLVGFNQNDTENFSKAIEVDWLPGMGTLIHRSVIETIGYWDEKVFPQYHGDSDFTFRAKIKGYKIKAYPQLRIWNNKEQTGLSHRGKFKFLFRSLFDIKSNFNIKKDYLFYKRFVTSIKAYGPLIYKYYVYIGGFFKWKFLKLLGIQRSN